MSNIIEPATADIAVTLEILQYTSQLENVVHIKAVSDSIFDITLEGDSWYNGTDRDKRKFCKSVNETLTVICQKYSNQGYRNSSCLLL